MRKARSEHNECGLPSKAEIKADMNFAPLRAISCHGSPEPIGQIDHEGAAKHGA